MVESEATGPDPAAESTPKASAPRRPPVTIDLAANPVGPEQTPEPPPRESDAGEIPEDEPPSAFGDDDSPPPPDEPARSFSFLGGLPIVPLAIAAGVGALAALVIAFLAATAGLVPTPASRDAATALERIAKAARDIEGARANEARIVTELQAVSARLAGVETMARDLVTTTEQLRGLDGTAAANEALINQLAAQVSDLRATIKSMAVTDAGAAGNGAELSALSARIDEMSARLTALGEKPATDTQTAAAARTMAFAGLRDAAERGEPFGDTLRLLSMLGVDAALLAPLEPAKDGVPSGATLAVEFEKVSRDIIAADATTESDGNLFWRIVHQLGSLVTVRPAGPVAGSSPVAIVSRMRAAVNSGDFETALRERAALPEAGKAASEEWARAAAARGALDKAVAGLSQAIETASAGQ